MVYVVLMRPQVDLRDDHQHQQMHDLVGVQPVVEGPRVSPVLGVQGGEPALWHTRCVYAGCHYTEHLQDREHHIVLIGYGQRRHTAQVKLRCCLLAAWPLATACKLLRHGRAGSEVALGWLTITRSSLRMQQPSLRWHGLASCCL